MEGQNKLDPPYEGIDVRDLRPFVVELDNWVNRPWEVLPKEAGFKVQSSDDKAVINLGQLATFTANINGQIGAFQMITPQTPQTITS